MFKKLRITIFLITTSLFLISCGGSSENTDTGSEILIPKLENLTYGKLKGRAGHEGIFPLDAEPVAGKVYGIVTTRGDVSSLSIVVNSEAGVEKKYLADSPVRVVGFLKIWHVELSFSSGKSTLKVMMSTPTGEEYFSIENEVITKNIDVKLSRSDYDFSSGENTVIVDIFNYGSDSTFLVSATDNYNFVKNNFKPMVVSIKKNESTSINIPINIEKNNLTEDIYDYEILIHVKNEKSTDFNLGKMKIDVIKSPTGVSDKYKFVVVNLGKCSPISKKSLTVDVVIAGSGKLYLDDVDVNSVFLMNGKIKPISVSINDTISFNNHLCSDIKKDGLNDLVMTFPLQDIINEDDSGTNNLPVYINYSNTDGLSGDVVDFVIEMED